jgi:hypothetical protein
MPKSPTAAGYCVLVLLVVASGCQRVDVSALSLFIIDQHPTPIVTKGSPDTEENKYGFEGGRVVKVKDTYHLFISELTGDPKWAKTKLAHWTSRDGFTFERKSTLYESSGDYTGTDPRAALFLPIPVFDNRQDRWNLFHSAFKSAPSSGGRWLINHEGRIHHAVSKVAGIDGIDGPYVDQGIVLQPGPDSDRWEGLQGTDSFFPFRVGDKWLAFYGSAHTQRWPTDFWAVGLVESEQLGGPWKRLTEINPILKPRYENPHVHQLRKNLYMAVCDIIIEKGPEARRIAYTFSTDGRAWLAPKVIQLEAGEKDWIQQVRTPISLIPTGNDEFIIFYTAVGPGRQYSSVSRVTVKLTGLRLRP